MKAFFALLAIFSYITITYASTSNKTKSKPVGKKKHFRPNINNESLAVSEPAHLLNPVPAPAPIEGSETMQYYHAILNSTYFYGSWASNQQSNIFDFDQQEGFLFMSHRSHQTFDLQITLYNGRYVDQGAVSLSYDYTANSPIVDPANGTVSFQRLWVEYRHNDASRLQNDQNFCMTMASFYFIDLRTNTPLNLKGQTSVNVENVGIQVEINNEMCPFNLTTSIMTNKDKLVESQYVPYAIVTVLFVAAQGILTHIYCNIISSRQNEARNTSGWSFMFLNAFDFYLTIFNTANFIDPMMFYAIISIPYLFLSLNMQRIIWGIFDTQTLHLDETTRDRTICEMYIWIYIVLIVPSTAAFLINPDVIFYVTFAFMIPQIIHNFKHSKKYKGRPLVLGGLLFPKLVFMSYLKLDADNIFRYTPNTNSYYIFIGLIAIQIITLLIQTEWPRFGFEVKSSYYFFEADQECTSQNICAICLESFIRNENANPTEPLLFEAQDNGKMIRTPCKHEFHEDCLKRWTEAKLECPYCRRALPAMSEVSDDDGEYF